jgi:sigma-B regulation protein RsbU (phosphoserine phosphatase)
MVLGALNMEFRSGTQPQEVLKRVNQLLCDKSLSFQFVTLFLFLLRPGGEGRFISAGHNPAYLFRSATETIEELAPDAFALGMFESACFQSRQFHLDGGDLLIVYSDGLTDAENPQEEMFGEERLLEIIQREAPAGSRAVEQTILKGIADFTQGMPQTDDITLVVVEKSL